MKQKLFISSVFLLAGISIITSNIQFATPKQAYTLRGTVVKRTNGKRISGATIIINQAQQTATDEVGQFIVRGLHFGANIITVKSSGFQKIRKTVYIRKGVTRVFLKLKRIAGDEHS